MNVIARGLSGLLALALATSIAARPVAVCAGMIQTAAPGAMQAHAQHMAHAGHQPAAPHHHHDGECCGVCATACGGCVAPAAGASLAPLAVTSLRIAPPETSLVPKIIREHLRPFAIGPPATIVA
ncbi:MAG: hypothetical protein ACHQX4_01395 [Gemmatimonadales bacterium]